MTMMKTFTLKQKEIKKEWFLINADGVVLGRLASYISKVLRGKHKTTFSPHLDCGDNVIVINAEKIKLKGKKAKDKIYYKHTGYPGGIKSTNPEKLLSGANPEVVLEMAVKRMLSNNKISRDLLRNLRVYCGENHNLEAQKPKLIEFSEMNRKNI